LSNEPNYAKPLFFEVSPLNPQLLILIDLSQTLTTFSLGQSPVELEMSLGPISTQF